MDSDDLVLGPLEISPRKAAPVRKKKKSKGKSKSDPDMKGISGVSSIPSRNISSPSKSRISSPSRDIQLRNPTKTNSEPSLTTITEDGDSSAAVATLPSGNPITTSGPPLTTQSQPSSPSRVSRRTSNRASMVWKSLEEGDFESDLANELESKWLTGASQGSIMLQTIKGACKRIWGRPVANLCLQSDLPRLSLNLEIVDERTATVLYKADPQKPHQLRVREIIFTLAKEVDGLDVANKVISQFDLYANSDGDVSTQIDAWAKHAVSSYDHQPVWLQVLRCVNQGIVFPAVFHMKKLFTDKFSYKDTKGSWKVRISIINKDTIEIQHKKGEKSQGTSAQNNFTFAWQMTFRLDVQLSDLDVTVSIIDYILDKDMKKETKEELLASMQPFLHGAAPYIAIWRKPLRKLPVHRDFGRLCGRLSVFNHLGKSIYVRSPSDNGATLIRRVLTTLADIFSPELTPGIEESLEKHLRDDGETMEMLTKVFHQDKVVPDDTPLAAVLKCINTTVVFPAVDQFHSHLYEKIRYKDVRGTWATHITLGPAIRPSNQRASSLFGGTNIFAPCGTPQSMNSAHSSFSEVSTPGSFSSGASAGTDTAAPSASAMLAAEGDIPRYRYVSILHRKCEQSHSDDPKEAFQFEWTVEIILNREMSIKEVNTGVVNFSFGPQTSDETKSLVLTSLKPFLKPATLQTTATAVSSHEILDMAIKKIEELEIQQKELIACYHNNMPHSLPLITLLQALKASLPVSSDVRLVSAETHSQHKSISPEISNRSSRQLPKDILAGSPQSSPSLPSPLRSSTPDLDHGRVNPSSAGSL